MYPSGTWRGFWEQKPFGRQPMTAFELHFRGDTVTGRGMDVIGVFLFRGTCDESTGRVRMTKQYLGKHKVDYDGWPDGEGSIGGTWRNDDGWTGPFQMMPELTRPVGDEPIIEIK